jgi:hypothetical protein
MEIVRHAACNAGKTHAWIELPRTCMNSSDWQDDEHTQRQEEYGGRGVFHFLSTSVDCTSLSARAPACEAFGGCIRDTATAEARSIDSK